MHLLTEPWLQVSTQTGDLRWIRLCEVAEAEWNDIVAPRADFRGALYQLLIGLLRTTLPPADREHWLELWDSPPTTAELEKVFGPWNDAFHLSHEGPAFMQDLKLPEDCNHLPVLDLLIDAGSDSNRYFNKPVDDYGLCEICAAQALLSLQLNAPSGGRGIRTSLRGGGPLTTLLLPSDAASSLWHKLWLNVVPTDALPYPPIAHRADVMPWLRATRSSDAQGVGETPPKAVHPLQAYWGMPRRIRLDATTMDQGECSICGARDVPRYRHYFTRHGGTNYTGPWLHPLTPYSIDPKDKDKPPISAKGRQAGRGYRDWLGLVLGDDNHQPDAAQVVRFFTGWRHPRKAATRLWCFGFDFSNMKAMCWYDAQLPVHEVAPARLPAFIRTIKQVLDNADNIARSVQGQVKSAWFKRPADRKSEPAVSLGFWQSSEPLFFDVLEALTDIDCNDLNALRPVYHRWLGSTRPMALSLFDQWALSGDIDGLDLKQVTRARADLAIRLGKSQKPLWDLISDKGKERA